MAIPFARAALPMAVSVRWLQSRNFASIRSLSADTIRSGLPQARRRYGFWRDPRSAVPMQFTKWIQVPGQYGQFLRDNARLEAYVPIRYVRPTIDRLLFFPRSRRPNLPIYGVSGETRFQRGSRRSIPASPKSKWVSVSSWNGQLATVRNHEDSSFCRRVMYRAAKIP